MKSFELKSDIKAHLRQLIPNTAKEHNIVPDVIFTLTGKEMLDVPVFLEAFPKANIICIERNKEDFKSIVQQGGVTIFNTTVSDYASFNLHSPHHGIIFLDYLGGLDQDKLQDIMTFISNPNLVRPDQKTVLALTFQKGNRQGKDRVLDLVKEIWDEGEIVNDIKSATGVMITNLCKIRSKVTAVEYLEYKNNNSSSAMYFMLFVLE